MSRVDKNRISKAQGITSKIKGLIEAVATAAKGQNGAMMHKDKERILEIGGRTKSNLGHGIN